MAGMIGDLHFRPPQKRIGIPELFVLDVFEVVIRAGASDVRFARCEDAFVEGKFRVAGTRRDVSLADPDAAVARVPGNVPDR